MLDAPDPGFEEARERMQAMERLRTSRVEAREQLTREEYHLRRIEASLAMINEEIETLERPTLTGLLASVLGTKHHHVDRMREDQAAVLSEADSVTAAIETIQARLKDLERDIDSFGNPEAELLELIESTERAILDRDDETAVELRAMNEALSAAREEMRKTKAALESGEAVLKRTRTLCKSLGRARKNYMHVHGSPLLSAGWNVVKARGAREHVARVRDGLRRFHEHLMALDARTEALYDIEIVRVAPIIEHIFTEEMGGSWEQWAVLFTDAGHPMEREVHALVGCLEERLGHFEKVSSEIELRKREFVAEVGRSGG